MRFRKFVAVPRFASSTLHWETYGIARPDGLAVGGTVVGIVISPWGQQSGGHFNPTLTLAFYRLGKMRLADAFIYVVAQFSGAIGGVCIARYLDSAYQN